MSEYYDKDNLYILGEVDSPGLPCSYFVSDYFAYSKNNFKSIMNNFRLYSSIVKKFSYYCKMYFPELYKLYCDALLLSVESHFDNSQQWDTTVYNESVTFDDDNNTDEPGWKIYNEAVESMLSVWRRDNQIKFNESRKY